MRPGRSICTGIFLSCRFASSNSPAVIVLIINSLWPGTVNRLCSSPFPECQMYLTLLEAMMNPADMTEDISFVVIPSSEDFEVRFR